MRVVEVFLRGLQAIRRGWGKLRTFAEILKEQGGPMGLPFFYLRAISADLRT